MSAPTTQHEGGGPFQAKCGARTPLGLTTNNAAGTGRLTERAGPAGRSGAVRMAGSGLSAVWPNGRLVALFLEDHVLLQRNLVPLP